MRCEVQVMRSFRLLTVAVLALVLALSSTQSAYAGQVGFGKICMPNDSPGVVFRFAVTEPSGTWNEDFRCGEGYAFVTVARGTYVFTELVSENPPGWVLRDIVCERISGGGETSWEIEEASVTIYHDPDDVVVCYFTNMGPSAAVGGYVEPASQLAIVGPYLALVGLFAAATVATVVFRKKFEMKSLVHRWVSWCGSRNLNSRSEVISLSATIAAEIRT
jgi:hypothetical protein